jgi:hypothetical protein
MGTPAAGRSGDHAAHRTAVWRSCAQAAALADKPLPNLVPQSGPQLQRLQRDRSQARMLLAGDPEQPGRAVRGTEKIPDAVTFDSGNVHPELREPPQRRRAESPQADNDHILRMTSITTNRTHTPGLTQWRPERPHWHHRAVGGRSGCTDRSHGRPRFRWTTSDPCVHSR